MSGLPMMPWFPRDWIAATRAQRIAERGAYHDLLCFQWEMGALPADHDRLAHLIGVTPEEFADIWPAIAEKFVERDGKLVNERLEKHRDKAFALQDRRRRGASATNRKRNAERPAERSAERDAERTAERVAKRAHPSPSPSPSMKSKKAKKLRSVDISVDNLDKTAWDLLQAYRRKKKIGAYVSDSMARHLAQYPMLIQRAAVDATIRNEWTGCFPERIKPNGSGIAHSEIDSRFAQHREALAKWFEGATADPGAGS